MRPEDVERALDGTGPWPSDLAPLVAAVRAPASPGELAGEETAVAAFLQARAEPAHPVRRTLARALAVKVAVGVAVLTAGGYAVAAASGAVPAPPFVPERAPVATTPAKHPGGNRTAVPQQPLPVASLGTPHRSATSYAGLCRSYFNGPPRRDTPPMRDLIAAAGGVDRVPAFCAAAGVPAAGAPASSGSAAAPGQKTKPPKESKSPKPSKSPKASKSPEAAKPPKTPAGQPAGDAR
jgi:hypothetical protein